MLWVIDPIGAIFGAKSRYQKQQIAVAQQQLAIAATQKIIAEDQLAISCVPVEQRSTLLQTRIAKRARDARNAAVARLCTGAVLFFGVVGLLAVVHQSDPTPARAAAATVSTPMVTASAFQSGRADRQAWEDWFDATSGDFRTGALWWSGQRSLPHPKSCAALGADAKAGCMAAKAKLDLTDARRHAEPDYRAGWNSL
jgi:hypothetical protein